MTLEGTLSRASLNKSTCHIAMSYLIREWFEYLYGESPHDMCRTVRPDSDMGDGRWRSLAALPSTGNGTLSARHGVPGVTKRPVSRWKAASAAIASEGRGFNLPS